MAKIKEAYLLILIVIGLISLSLYSTYALFTTSTEIKNVVNFEATLTTSSNIIEYDMINVAANETKTVEVKINNNYSSTLYYGAWYEVASPSSNANVLVYLKDSDGVTSGQIKPGSSVNLSIMLQNKGTSDAVINVGTVASMTSNLGLEDTKELIELPKPKPPSPALTSLTNLGLEDEINDTVLTTFTGTSIQEGTTGIYKTVDDLGDSYYFRGNVVNNYVKYGKNASGQDMWWRIVRINGDGSVRMIYDGTSAHANGEASTDRQTITTSYNTYREDNAFVGYMNGRDASYGTKFPSGGTNSTSYEEAHTNTRNSSMKSHLENWYKTNIVDTGYSASVVDAIYCNDRSITDDYLGYGTNKTYYSAYNRNYTDTATPTLICSRQEDKFTKNSTLGNGKLTYPIGLITVDELVFGGLHKNGGGATNKEIYLYNDSNYYWTMTPVSFFDERAFVGYVSGSSLGYWYVDYSFTAVRPVITLSSTAINGGTGISTDPFVVIPSLALTTLKSLGLDDEIDDTELTTFTTSSNNDGTTGIYKTVDDLGDSYYFRGNVVNNYVKYGKNSSGQDMWWRIIRINGDGSVRMIYDGTSAHANNEASTDRQVFTGPYNIYYTDNAFVGYMNGTIDGTNFPSGGTNSTSYEEAHANITDSPIKSSLDNWYKKNIVDTGYSDNVVDAIYCNDRTRVTDQTKNDTLSALFGFGSKATGEGFGTYATFYSLLNRITNDATGVTPSLICSRQEDKFTKNSSLGNGKLSYPVGLITLDELTFGGSFFYMSAQYNNDQTYLYNGSNYYWTMSPFYFNYNDDAVVGRAYGGAISVSNINVNSFNTGVRPVITLSSSAINDGSGISTDPFTVS